MGTKKQLLNLADAQLGTQGGRKYWEYYNGSGTYVNGDVTPYCAYYDSWLLDNTDTDCPFFPSAVAFDESDYTGGRWVDKYDLQPGDMVAFDWDEDARGDHVGVVWSVHDWGCVCNEGNTNGGIVDLRQRVWGVIIGGIRPYYDLGAKQEPGNARNDIGLHYRMHIQDYGWLDPVHDGQTAGIPSHALRGEGIKITPPEGVVLDAFAHVQNIGTLGYPGIVRSSGSGTGSSDEDPIIGTTGRSQRLEGLMLRVVSNDGPAKGKQLWYQAHVQDYGWMPAVKAGQWAGTRGQAKRLEAIRMWFQ